MPFSLKVWTLQKGKPKVHIFRCDGFRKADNVARHLLVEAKLC